VRRRVRAEKGFRQGKIAADTAAFEIMRE